jgi:hypothetical protein
LIAVGMTLNKITNFGKKNCIYTVRWWSTGKLDLSTCRTMTDSI